MSFIWALATLPELRHLLWAALVAGTKTLAESREEVGELKRVGNRSLSPATMPNIGAAMPDGAAMAVVVWDAAGGALVTGGARDGATRAASVSFRRPPAAPVRVVVAAGSSLPPDLARPRELDRLRPWRGVAWRTGLPVSDRSALGGRGA